MLCSAACELSTRCHSCKTANSTRRYQISSPSFIGGARATVTVTIFTSCATHRFAAPQSTFCCASKYFIRVYLCLPQLSLSKSRYFLHGFPFSFLTSCLHPFSSGSQVHLRVSQPFLRTSSLADCLLVHQTKLAKIGNRCQRHFPPRSGSLSIDSAQNF